MGDRKKGGGRVSRAPGGKRCEGPGKNVVKIAHGCKVVLVRVMKGGVGTTVG